MVRVTINQNIKNFPPILCDILALSNIYMTHSDRKSPPCASEPFFGMLDKSHGVFYNIFPVLHQQILRIEDLSYL